MGFVKNFLMSLINRANANASTKTFNDKTVKVEIMDNKANPTITEVILKIGKIEFYVMTTLADKNAGIESNEFYWRDDGSPQGHGPFDYLSQAGEHYAHVQKMFNQIPLPQKPKGAQIISVDFQLKKKV